jgi:UDPglucose 6-dehydrogenase
MNALKMANVRIISDKYLTGGMGDGGACHPRDNIALSWLSRKVDLSCDWFEHIMLQREKQTEWLVDLIEAHAGGRDIVILGKVFKPETNIVTGSPSMLLRNIVQERGISVIMWDPYIDEPIEEACLKLNIIDQPKLYFIGTKHSQFVHFPFASGSVVLDPWRYIPDKPEIEVIRIGG